jgi:DNA polymerase I-like protein with 3'-5' exonuclease and polymerase domains
VRRHRDEGDRLCRRATVRGWRRRRNRLRLHDELVLETAVEDVEQAAGLLREAMTDAFVELLPDAPLNGLVEPHIGRDWSEAK